MNEIITYFVQGGRQSIFNLFVVLCQPLDFLSTSLLFGRQSVRLHFKHINFPQGGQKGYGHAYDHLFRFEAARIFLRVSAQPLVALLKVAFRRLTAMQNYWAKRQKILTGRYIYYIHAIVCRFYFDVGIFCLHFLESLQFLCI